MAEHPIEVVPPANGASPHDLNHPPSAEAVPFWTPTWRDVARHMGWRWLLFAPAVLLVAGLAAAFAFLPWHWWSWANVLVGYGKLIVTCVGLAVASVGVAVQSAIRVRSEPFCIHCGYDLTGLADGGRCPECGRTFSLKVVEEYRRDPQWFARRYRQRDEVPAADLPFVAGAVRRRRSRDGT